MQSIFKKQRKSKELTQSINKLLNYSTRNQSQLKSGQKDTMYYYEQKQFKPD